MAESVHNVHEYTHCIANITFVSMMDSLSKRLLEYLLDKLFAPRLGDTDPNFYLLLFPLSITESNHNLAI